MKKLLAALMVSSLFACSVFAQGDVLKIGLISPLSGANARYGAFAGKGASQIAAREVCTSSNWESGCLPRATMAQRIATVSTEARDTANRRWRANVSTPVHER